MEKFVRWMYGEVRDTVALADIARTKFENRTEFDRAFLGIKLMEQNSSIEQKKKALADAHEKLEKLAKYSRWHKSSL